MEPIVSSSQPDRRKSYSIVRAIGENHIVIEHVDGTNAYGGWCRIVDHEIALCTCRHDADRVVDGLRLMATL